MTLRALKAMVFALFTALDEELPGKVAIEAGAAAKSEDQMVFALDLASSRDTGHFLGFQGQEWQQPLNVGHAFQTVYLLYDGLSP